MSCLQRRGRTSINESWIAQQKCRGKPHFNNIIKFLLILLSSLFAFSSFCAPRACFVNYNPARKFNFVKCILRTHNTLEYAHKTTLILHVKRTLLDLGKSEKGTSFLSACEVIKFMSFTQIISFTMAIKQAQELGNNEITF